MKRTRFTLVELVIVVAAVAMFAVIFAGCGIFSKREECANNLKQISFIGQQYLDDQRSCWANSASESYIFNLYRGKYIPDDMSLDYAFCPSIRRDPDQRGSIRTSDQSNIQMYAAIGSNLPRSDEWRWFGIYTRQTCWSKGADRIGGEATKDVNPSRRLWFCDGLRPDIQRQRTLLAGTPGAAGYLAQPYPIHEGRINIVTMDGHVESVKPQELGEYYVPYMDPERGKTFDPRSQYSVRVGAYISPKEPSEVRNLAD